MNINSMNGEDLRRRYSKSQLAYAILQTHRSDALLYRVVNEDLLEKIGWTMERYKKVRGGLPPLLIDQILAEEGLTWQELNLKLS